MVILERVCDLLQILCQIKYTLGLGVRLSSEVCRCGSIHTLLTVVGCHRLINLMEDIRAAG